MLGVVVVGGGEAGGGGGGSGGGGGGDSGMAFTAIDMVNWNIYISSQCISLPSDWWSNTHWYPTCPYGVSNQINWLVCNAAGLQIWP